MSTDLRHRLGRTGERLAGAHLERRGFTILTRNHRTRFGELDIVACDGARIVFCEVKTRRLGSSSPFDGLRHSQCVRIRKMAAAWLQESVGTRPYIDEIRFDAIGVTIDARGRLVEIEHLEGAF